MRTTPIAPTASEGSHPVRHLAVAATSAAMSVAAHAAGGGAVSPVPAAATALGAAAVTTAVLRGRLTPDRSRLATVTIVGAVILANQVLGHALLHAGHLVATLSVSPARHDHAAMTMGDHAHGAMPADDGLSMLLPSHTMLAAHAIGAVLAATLLATAFGLADRIELARRRAVSRPPHHVVDLPSPRRPAEAIGREDAGHLRIPHSRGPPLLLR